MSSSGKKRSKTNADMATVDEYGVRNTETMSTPKAFTSPIVNPSNTVFADKPVMSNFKKVAPGSKYATDNNPNVQTASFEIDGISPPLANMLRRLIVTEVPTLAIDRVMIRENDGVVLDELLAHRLGLCPVLAPVEEFDYIIAENQFNPADEASYNPKLVLKFELDVKSTSELHNVYSRDLKFVPLPGQEGMKVEMVHQDILLAKLGIGQRINLTAFAVKGLGYCHAKFTPVAGCWYEMKTEITLKEDIKGDEAQRLKKICPRKVFDIEDGDAFVKDATRCTVCRECVNDPKFGKIVEVGKHKTSVKFTVESTGQYQPEEIVRLALTLFADRCRALRKTVKSCAVEVTGGKEFEPAVGGH